MQGRSIAELKDEGAPNFRLIEKMAPNAVSWASGGRRRRQRGRAMVNINGGRREFAAPTPMPSIKSSALNRSATV